MANYGVNSVAIEFYHEDFDFEVCNWGLTWEIFANGIKKRVFDALIQHPYAKKVRIPTGDWTEYQTMAIEFMTDLCCYREENSFERPFIATDF